MVAPSSAHDSSRSSSRDGSGSSSSGHELYPISRLLLDFVQARLALGGFQARASCSKASTKPGPPRDVLQSAAKGDELDKSYFMLTAKRTTIRIYASIIRRPLIQPSQHRQKESQPCTVSKAHLGLVPSSSC